MITKKERPETLNSYTTKIRTGFGNLYVTVTELDEKPFEVFTTIGKSGRSLQANSEGISRLCSLCLRLGIDVRELIKQLKGIGSDQPIAHRDGLVLSLPDAISRVLERRYLKTDEKSEDVHKSENKLSINE